MSTGRSLAVRPGGPQLQPRHRNVACSVPASGLGPGSSPPPFTGPSFPQTGLGAAWRASQGDLGEQRSLWAHPLSPEQPLCRCRTLFPMVEGLLGVATPAQPVPPPPFLPTMCT